MKKLAEKYHELCSRLWLALPLSYIVGSGISFEKFRLFHLVALIYLVDVLFHFKKVEIKNWEIPFLLFFAWELLTSFWSSNLNLTVKYLFCLGNGYVLIFLIRHYFQGTKDEIQKILHTIFRFNLLMMILAVLEVFGMFRWPFNLYSQTFYNSDFNKLLEIYNTDTNGLAYFKSLPSVFFWNSNDLCFYLISTIPLLFIIQLKEKWFKYLYILLTFFILIANTGRATIFGFIIFLVLTIIFSNQEIKFKKFLAGILVGLLSILIFASQLSFLGYSRQNRLRSFSGSFIVYSNIKIAPTVADHLYITSSTVKRSGYLHMALEQFKQHPMKGIGAGNLLLKYENNTPANVHNFWVEILVETGAVGFLLFLSWIVWWLVRIRRLGEDFKFIFLTFVVIIPSALSVSSAEYQPGFWIPVMVLYLFQKRVVYPDIFQ